MNMSRKSTTIFQGVGARTNLYKIYCIAVICDESEFVRRRVWPDTLLALTMERWISKAWWDNTTGARATTQPEIWTMDYEPHQSVCVCVCVCALERNQQQHQHWKLQHRLVHVVTTRDGRWTMDLQFSILEPETTDEILRNLGWREFVTSSSQIFSYHAPMLTASPITINHHHSSVISHHSSFIKANEILVTAIRAKRDSVAMWKPRAMETLKATILMWSDFGEQSIFSNSNRHYLVLHHCRQNLINPIVSMLPLINIKRGYIETFIYITIEMQYCIGKGDRGYGDQHNKRI